MGLYSAALPYMGYDVVGMGEMEAGYIKDTGNAQPFGGRVALIATNFADFATGKVLGDAPYVIKTTREGLKVGITTVYNDQFASAEAQERRGLKLLPAADTLRKYVSELRPQVDILIVLSHTGYEMAKKLAAEVQGIDLMLTGHLTTSKPGVTTEQIGSTTLMQDRSSGKYVGKLVLNIGEDRKIAGVTGEYVPVGPDLAEDPEVMKLVAKHDAGVQEYYNEMRAKAGQPAAPTVVNYEPRAPQPFKTSSSCFTCHRKEHEQWSQTDHARAFEDLRKDGRLNDPECQSCHTTGFKSKGGFTSATGTPQLAGVQCEACHGPGVRHVKNPVKGWGAVLRSTCTECHTPSQSPDFDYEEYRRRILHTSK